MRLPTMTALLLSAGLGRIPEWRNARARNLPASKRGNTGVPAACRAKDKHSKSRG